MRIVGGEWRHRSLQAPAGVATRPTSDRLRETLFNILGPAVRGRSFVDAYAGSGAVGLEAASRGAGPVVWIESARPALQALHANLERLSPGAPRGHVIARPVLAALPRAETLLPDGAGYFFLDPPYDDFLEYERVLAALARRRGLIAPETWVIVESRRGPAAPRTPAGFACVRVVPAGQSQLSLLRLQPPLP